MYKTGSQHSVTNFPHSQVVSVLQDERPVRMFGRRLSGLIRLERERHVDQIQVQIVQLEVLQRVCGVGLDITGSVADMR